MSHEGLSEPNPYAGPGIKLTGMHRSKITNNIFQSNNQPSHLLDNDVLWYNQYQKEEKNRHLNDIKVIIVNPFFLVLSSLMQFRRT